MHSAGYGECAAPHSARHVCIGACEDQRRVVAFGKADSVVAVDYAFASYPREISAGRHSIAFRNAGKQRHEFSIVLLKQGVTADSVNALDKAKGDVRPLFENHIGVLHSRGGETALGLLDIDFLAGREYLVECGFQDDDKSPPHYELGMTGSIRVSPAHR
jgi:hypothetical protein